MAWHCLKHTSTASQDMSQPWSYSQLHVDKEQMLPNRFVPKRNCQILQIPTACCACFTEIQELQVLAWLVRVLTFCIHANPQFTSVPGRGKAESRQNQLVKEELQSRINHCFCTPGSLPYLTGHPTDPVGRRWWCCCQLAPGHFCHVVVRAGSGQNGSVLGRPHLDKQLNVGYQQYHLSSYFQKQ